MNQKRITEIYNSFTNSNLTNEELLAYWNGPLTEEGREAVRLILAERGIDPHSERVVTGSQRTPLKPVIGGYVCRSCGYKGYPARVTKGSFFIELILWLCFLVPGLIYSIWRLTSRYDACPKCGSAAMIPVDTPVGKQQVTVNRSTKKCPFCAEEILIEAIKCKHCGEFLKK